MLPLIIFNEGTLISKVYIDVVDPDKAFTLTPTGDTRAFITEGYDKQSEFKAKKYRSFIMEYYAAL